MDDARPLPRRWLTAIIENPFLKLGSVVIATLAWLYVQGGQVTEAKVRTPVEWRLPAGLATTEPLPQTVMVQVKGSRSATRRAQRSELTLSADLSDLVVGEHNVEIGSLELRGLAPGVDVTGYAPSTVRFLLDKETVRKVHVKPVTVGDPAVGFSVIKTTIEPTVVEVRGPRLILADLVELSTRPIDVSNLAADIEEGVDLELPFGVKMANGVDLRVKVDIEPLVERKTIESVPVIVRDKRYQTETAVVEVTVQGPAAALRILDRDAVTAVIVMPEDATRTRYQVGFGAREGARITVLFAGGDDVKVLSVRPPVLEVQAVKSP